MHLIFADDSGQKKPFRPGMGPLTAIGGVIVPGLVVNALEKDIDALCSDFGFPPDKEFKWHPKKNTWMRDNLYGDAKRKFYLGVIRLLKDAGVRLTVVVEDEDKPRACVAESAQSDVTCLFLERVNHELAAIASYGIVIADQPSGGKAEEKAFLARCVERLRSGTVWVKFDRIALNVLCSPSDHVRLLQAADLVIGVVVAKVAGMDKYAGPIFEALKPLFRRDGDRIGGIGLKIWPDTYQNLYYWLLGDTSMWSWSGQRPLPNPDKPFSEDPMVP